MPGTVELVVQAARWW